jgi:hypothetical protein
VEKAADGMEGSITPNPNLIFTPQDLVSDQRKSRGILRSSNDVTYEREWRKTWKSGESGHVRGDFMPIEFVAFILTHQRGFSCMEGNSRAEILLLF